MGYFADEAAKAEPKAKDHQGWIYFVLAGDAVKIGYSLDPEKRLQHIRVGNPEEAVLLGKIDGTPRTERALHWKLRQYRLRGEWFSAAAVPHLMQLMQDEFGE